MWKNLGVLLVATALTIGAFELSVREGALPLPDFFESSGWWNEHWHRRKRGPVPREFVRIDRDLGWIPAPDLSRYPYQGAHISTNASSIRGPIDYAPGPSDQTRIVALGDSFMFGQCLNDQETIPARLQEKLPGSQVINLGVMGYGHGQMLERLRRDGLVYEPAVVLLGFHPWDMTRNRLDFRDYGKPRFVLDDGGLRLTNVPVPEPGEYEAQPLRLVNYVRMLWDALRPRARAAEDHALSLALTRAIADESAAAGARFALVYLPPLDEAGGEPIATPFLAEACRARNWLCVGPGPRIAEAWPARRHRKRHFKCHYSPELADLVAQVTAEAMRGAWPDLFAGSAGH